MKVFDRLPKADIRCEAKILQHGQEAAISFYNQILEKKRGDCCILILIERVFKLSTTPLFISFYKLGWLDAMSWLLLAFRTEPIVFPIGADSQQFRSANV
ncbi:hypothetical protein [uncultured Sulfitobacter sp.]|uniref:hypothetical protein n=1 Tax=uncultured Sulfitobacter sp. TaxID=191468 RepID=UPI002591CDCA|nr:hypothetical protein [uncultured Sulfitobacter sp.]